MHGKRWPPLLLALLVLLEPVGACGPGRGAGGRRAARRKLTPFVFKQHLPNLSENTLGASGLPEGRVSRKDSRFKDLVPNHNPDIIFKDEEDNGADRLMTKRCTEKLNTLAISVMNQWPGVKLRVIEAWDEEGVHATDSLHYEGRAVDITTSDRDRSKLGLLARLAVQAGFDWVYYESRSHIHCSVKSESSQAAKSGGCFHSNSSVETPSGPKPLWSVRPGDQVLAATDDGRPIYSEVLQLLDRDVTARRLFYVLETEGGARLSLTPHHLVPVVRENKDERHMVFALNVRPGQSIYVMRHGQIEAERVTNITRIVQVGVIAPLTRHGTIVVDGVLASCYALFEWPRIAHWAFWPVRLVATVASFLPSGLAYLSPSDASVPNGVHWYSELLYSVAETVLPEHLLPQ